MGVREHPVGHSHVKANGAARSLGFASTARALRILVISDDTKTLALFKKALPHTGARGKRSPLFRLTLCRRADQGLAAVKKSARDGLTFSVVFLDGQLFSNPDGVRMAQEIRALDPALIFALVADLSKNNSLDLFSRVLPDDKLVFVKKPVSALEVRHLALVLGSQWRSERMVDSSSQQDLTGSAGERTTPLKEAKRQLKGRTTEHRDDAEALKEAYDVLEQRMAERTQELLTTNRDLMLSQKLLQDHKTELEYVNKQLMDANTALSVLIRNVERTRRESEQRMIKRMRTIVIPFIKKLEGDKNLVRYKPDFNLLIGFIENLTADLAQDLKMASGLSVTELRIASFIKNGMTSETIADHLHISLDTVKTHRKNIRRKLDIKNSGRNLQVFLESEFGEDRPAQG